MSTNLELALREELVQAVAELAEVDPATIAMETTLLELDIDSLRALELVVRVERKFQIRLTEAEIRMVRTVGDMVQVALAKGAA